MFIESIINKNEIDHVQRINELCDCKDDLIVLKVLKNEKKVKISEIEAKFSPYYFTKEKIGCYCDKCRKVYLVDKQYECSSKIDFETISYIREYTYDKLQERFKSLKDIMTMDTVNDVNSITLDRYNIIEILDEEDSEKEYVRTLLYTNKENEYKYTSVIKCCDNCEHRLYTFCEETNKTVLYCLNNKNIVDKNNLCEDFGFDNLF